MQKSKRLNLIKDYIKTHKDVKITELNDLLDVSESTIRRDVKDLAHEGFLKELYGSVIYIEKNQPDTYLNERLKQKLEVKEVIGAKAAKLIEDDDTIYIDSGSTTFYMIRYITASNITIITNGIHIASEALNYHLNTYLIGGELKPLTNALVGEIALESLNHFQFDKCFMGANGFTQKGYSTPDIKEGIIKKHVISRSRKKYICADLSKEHIHTAYLFAKKSDCQLISE
ncbi:MAG: DeoR/GlpR family DNA-binding transcription regulator [Candidatus Izemoplasmataceae bacterium]